MKCLVFDTSAIISIATNNLLYILKPLKKKYGGDFCLPSAVRAEIIDRPLGSKKFKLEAIQVLTEVLEGTLSLKDESDEEVKRIANLANSIFIAQGNYISILHGGETAVIVLAKRTGAEAVIIDERTTRLMIESPMSVAKLLGKKMHTGIKVNRKNLNAFKDYTKGMIVLRSVELAIIAYDRGLLKRYTRPESKNLTPLNPRRDVLDGLLWGLKLRGCSISPEEIEEIMHLKGF
ncbi:MAG: hypothetical protein V1914_03960 [archaeon]